jgi:signal transduction histidine kinase
MQEVRVIAQPLPSGEIVAIGRNIDEIAKIAQIIRRAVIPTLLLAFVLAVAIGIALSLRAHRRLSEVSQKIQRIAPANCASASQQDGRTTCSTN